MALSLSSYIFRPQQVRLRDFGCRLAEVLREFFMRELLLRRLADNWKERNPCGVGLG